MSEFSIKKDNPAPKMEWSRLISDKRLGMEQYHDPILA